MIARFLSKARSSNMIFNCYFIFFRKITFSFKQINSVEAVISPAFTNFKVRLKLSNYLRIWIPWVLHLNSVLILWWFIQTFKRFQKDGYVIALSLAISVWINFKSPRYSIRHEWIWVNYFMNVSYPAEIIYHEHWGVIIWQQFRREIYRDKWVFNMLLQNCRRRLIENLLEFLY